MSKNLAQPELYLLSLQMKPLEPPDLHYLNAAVGWIELGNAVEAFDDLERIGPRYRFHPDVLVVRWILYAKAKKWERALDVAKAVVKLAPDRATGWVYLSYSLHELKRTLEAWMNLQSVANRFPKDGSIAFNLANYACKLGNVSEAKKWLARAVDLSDGDKIKVRVQKHPELQAILHQLGEDSAEPVDRVTSQVVR